jgi:hypothetical protein
MKQAKYDAGKGAGLIKARQRATSLTTERAAEKHQKRKQAGKDHERPKHRVDRNVPIGANGDRLLKRSTNLFSLFDSQGGGDPHTRDVPLFEKIVFVKI